MIVADPAPAPGEEADTDERTDTAVNPIIGGESVAIPTPAWGTQVMVDDTETVVAELVDDEDAPQSAPDAAAATAASTRPRPRSVPGPWLGTLALAFAVATAITHGLSVAAATDRSPDLATTLAWVSIGLSVAGVVAGALAVVLRRGRILGAFAAALALFANPWIVLQILTFFAL